MSDEERKHCEAVALQARSWHSVRGLADLIERERAAARGDERRKVLEEAAEKCIEVMRHCDTDDRHFTGADRCLYAIRALATKDGAK